MKIVPPFVRSPYNYDTNQVSDDNALDTGTHGGAKQSFKEECDINIIVKRFGIGYEMPSDLREPRYGDFTTVTNFHDMVNTVAQVNENFELLPAHIRAKFQNDPVQYVEFAIDEKNRSAMKEMGLLSEEALERDRIAQEKSQAEAQEATDALAEKRASAKIPPTGGSQPKKPG